MSCIRARSHTQCLEQQDTCVPYDVRVCHGSARDSAGIHVCRRPYPLYIMQWYAMDPRVAQQGSMYDEVHTLCILCNGMPWIHE